MLKFQFSSQKAIYQNLVKARTLNLRLQLWERNKISKVFAIWGQNKYFENFIQKESISFGNMWRNIGENAFENFKIQYTSGDTTLWRINQILDLHRHIVSWGLILLQPSEYRKSGHTRYKGNYLNSGWYNPVFVPNPKIINLDKKSAYVYQPNISRGSKRKLVSYYESIFLNQILVIFHPFVILALRDFTVAIDVQ